MRLKHGGKTRPWCSLYQMFHFIYTSYDSIEVVLGQKRELVRLQSIDKPLLEEVLGLLQIMCPLWDKLEMNDKPLPCSRAHIDAKIFTNTWTRRGYTPRNRTIQV